METLPAAIALVAIIAAVIFMRKRYRGGRRKAPALRRELHQILGMPRETADETIERYIMSLQDRYPGRSEEWYLEKIIHDLRRDR